MYAHTRHNNTLEWFTSVRFSVSFLFLIFASFFFVLFVSCFFELLLNPIVVVRSTLRDRAPGRGCFCFRSVRFGCSRLFDRTAHTAAGSKQRVAARPRRNRTGTERKPPAPGRGLSSARMHEPNRGGGSCGSVACSRGWQGKGIGITKSFVGVDYKFNNVKGNFA